MHGERNCRRDLSRGQALGELVEEAGVSTFNLFALNNLGKGRLPRKCRHIALHYFPTFFIGGANRHFEAAVEQEIVQLGLRVLDGAR